MAKVLERSGTVPRTPAPNVKPPTRFVQNLLKKKVITSQEADLLNQLATPHLQFEAVQRFKTHPQQGLAAHIRVVKELPSFAPTFLENTFTPMRGGAMGSAFEWVWQVLGQPRISIFMWKCFAGAALSIAMIVGLWNGLLWLSEHRKPVLTARPITPVVVTATAQPPPPAAASESHASHRAAGSETVALPTPQNFSIVSSKNQMTQLSWDSLGENKSYHLYSSSDETMKDAKLEDDAAIPVNWYNWMPPSEGSTIWLAVKGVGPDGRETPFSNVIKITPSANPSSPQQQ